MSIDNSYALNYVWKIDPDGRQDRSPGPVNTRKMTDDEKQKYGVAEKSECEDMNKLDIDENRMMEICREHGTGNEGAKKVAHEFLLTQKQAVNQIYLRKIKRRLESEKAVADENRRAALTAKEDFYGVGQLIEDLNVSDIKEIAEAVCESFTENAKDAVKTCSLNAAAEVDEMMEMVREKNNCNTGKYENIGQTIGSLVDRKNAQYGKSVNGTGDMLKLLYPNGIEPKDYRDLGVIVRMFDKMKRIVNGNQGDENAWQDIAGYAILQCGDGA